MSKLTPEELRSLKPPDGWEFVKQPTLKTVGSIRRTGAFSCDDVPKALQTLFTWAKKHRLGLKGETSVVVANTGGYGNVRVWNQFTLKANVSLSHVKAQFDHPESICAECGYTAEKSGTEAGHMTCRACRNNMYCYNCGTFGFSIVGVKGGRQDRIMHYACANCVDVCESPKCTNLCAIGGLGAKKCPVCDPVETCTGCRNYFPVRDMHKVKDEVLDQRGQLAQYAKYACKTCHEKFSCADCGAFSPRGLAKSEGKNLCSLCMDKKYDKERERLEKWSKQELPIHGSMQVPSMPERPTRLVSIETELDGDGKYLARTLYRCGLISDPNVRGYREYASNDMSHPAFLKYDGSVTAGELITFLLDMDDPVHAKALLEVLTKVRGLREMGKVSHGVTCGGHIHIDAHNFTFSDAWRLTTIWNYLEDPIFRLAGAGSPTGHRSLDPRSTRPNGGIGYSNPVVKGPWGTRSAFGLSIEQQDRHCGLNFKPYLEARAHCACGDLRYGDGKDCKCNLGKSTIEWRVWNSISNPRILHAWLAFMQAVHSYAQQDKEMVKGEEDRFPAMPWERKKFSALTQGQIKEWKERIEWVHKNLPLTNEERDSIVYALKSSEVAERLGHQYLDGLLAIENNHGLLAKVGGVRNPSRRERKITIKAPSPQAVDEGGLAVEASPFVDLPVAAVRPRPRRTARPLRITRQ
jgi:hypothetical protein